MATSAVSSGVEQRGLTRRAEEAPARREVVAAALAALLVVIHPASASAANSICQWNSLWSTVGSLATARYLHTATMLASGKVLVVGGLSGTTALASAELYDPVTGTFSATGSLGTPRHGHVAVRLRDGRVLVAGGWDPAARRQTESAEIYDPATGTFSPLGTGMTASRQDATAVLLSSGQVLVTGGFGRPPSTSFSYHLDTAETFDPSANRFLATAGPMSHGRSDHSATLLGDGRVLLAAGVDANGGLDTADVYDPVARTFTPAANRMLSSRVFHGAGLLPDGRVLLAGGAAPGSVLASTEVFDPGTNRFSSFAPLAAPRSGLTTTALPDGSLLVVGGATAAAERIDTRFAPPAPGALATARTRHAAVALANGDVLVIGGQDQAGADLASAELFDMAFSRTGPHWLPRDRHATALLASGEALLTGGRNPGTTGLPELYHPGKERFAPTQPQTSARELHTATPLPGGQVLLAGGFAGATASQPARFLDSLELYDPAAGTFRSAGAMSVARADHTATLLANGTVLLAGGSNSAGGLASAEVFDPQAGTVTSVGSMFRDRFDHTATLLPGGGVLIIGGESQGAGGIAFSVERYDPQSRTFTTQPQAGWLLTNRRGHRAALLGGGQVLVTGGLTSGRQPTPRAEIWDPGSQLFSYTANPMAAPRVHHTATATALPGGPVYVIGGRSAFSGGELESVEIYDPATRRFAPGGSLWAPRSGHTATLLTCGRILVAGGSGPGGALARGGELTKTAASCPAHLTGLQPASGLTGTTVTITGSGFGAVQGTSLVTFDGTPAAVTAWSDSQVVATVPGLGQGPVAVVVTVGCSPSETALFTITVPPPRDPPGPCPLRTAFRGTSLEPRLAALRAFRDRHLAGNAAGRALVGAYYRLAAPLARALEGSEPLRTGARWLATPAVLAISTLMEDGSGRSVGAPAQAVRGTAPPGPR